MINNKEAAAIAAEAVTELFGPGCLTEGKLGLGSESFSTLAAYYPSVMARLGVRNEDLGATADLHNPHFDLDEEALKYGIASHAAYAISYLERRPHIPFEPFEGTADDLLKLMNRPVPKRYDKS